MGSPRPASWTQRARRVVAVAIALLVITAALAAVRIYGAALRTNVVDLAFANALRIPPLLEPEATEGGGATFHLDAAAGTSEFLPGVETVRGDRDAAWRSSCTACTHVSASDGAATFVR